MPKENTLGIYEVPTFQPEDIDRYSVKNAQHESKADTERPSLILEKVKSFSDLLVALHDKIEHSGIEGRATQTALNELTATNNLLHHIHDIDEDARGMLYVQLMKMVNEESPTIDLLNEYGDSDDVVASIKDKAGLISGLVVSNQTIPEPLELDVAPLPSLGND